MVEFNNMKNKFSELTIIPCSAESEIALKQAAKTKLIDYLPGSDDFKLIGDINE